MEALGIGKSEEGVLVVPVFVFEAPGIDFAGELVGVNGCFAGFVSEGIFAAEGDLEGAVCGVEIDVDGVEEERLPVLVVLIEGVEALLEQVE